MNRLHGWASTSPGECLGPGQGHGGPQSTGLFTTESSDLYNGQQWEPQAQDIGWNSKIPCVNQGQFSVADFSQSVQIANHCLESELNRESVKEYLNVSVQYDNGVAVGNVVFMDSSIQTEDPVSVQCSDVSVQSDGGNTGNPTVDIGIQTETVLTKNVRVRMLE